MRKYNQKGIRNFVHLGLAENISNYDFEKMSRFLHEHNIERVGYSTGIYGINAGLLQDKDTGDMFAITSRCSALFMAF